MVVRNPFSMESFPREGPTVKSCRVLSGAGRAPALSTTAKSLASSVVNVPLITARPPLMRSLIVGAEYTFPSNTIAIRFPTLAAVTRSNSRAPLLSKVTLTLGSLKSPIDTRAS